MLYYSSFNTSILWIINFLLEEHIRIFPISIVYMRFYFPHVIHVHCIIYLLFIRPNPLSYNRSYLFHVPHYDGTQANCQPLYIPNMLALYLHPKLSIAASLISTYHGHLQIEETPDLRSTSCLHNHLLHVTPHSELSRWTPFFL